MTKQEMIKFVYYSNKWSAWFDITDKQAAELLLSLMEKKKKLTTIEKDKTLQNNITKQYHESKVTSWLRGLDVIFDYTHGCELLTSENVEWLEKNHSGLGLICPFK